MMVSAYSSTIYKFIVVSLLALFFLISTKQLFAATTPSLFPTADGTYDQWSPKSGSTHYTQVDESICNGSTDYNSETSVGQRDSYGVNLSSIPNGSIITQISITPCVSKNANGGQSTTFDVFYRLNGNNSADKPGYTLTGTTPTVQTATIYSGLSVSKSSTTTLEIGGIYTAGNKGVRMSNISTVIVYNLPITPTPTPTIAPPATPNNLVVTPISSTAANLTWADNSTNESGFRVERSIDGISGWVQVGTTLANTTTFDNFGLTPFQPYYFRVHAFNSGGDSNYSNVYSINTSIPNNPSLVILNAEICGGEDVPVTLSWNDNSFNENGFDVEYAADEVNYVPVGSTSANITALNDTSSSCAYRVRAFNSFGFSDWAYVYIID